MECTPEAEPLPVLLAGADPLLSSSPAKLSAHGPILLHSSCQPIVLILATISLSHPTSPLQQQLPERQVKTLQWRHWKSKGR